MNGETFTSPQEEIAYWKNLAHEYKQSLEDAKDELDEFQVHSHELEAELETQLEQAENKNRELTSQSQRLQMEVDILREKLEKQQSTTHKQITELEDALATVKAYKDELQKYIRELEQTNDDLERAKRATVVSLEDFEARLNQAIERNAFLESELEERETLAITVQRLKDEARDLRSELAVKEPNVKDGDLRQEMAVRKTSDIKTKLEQSELKSPDVEKKEFPTDHIDSNRIADGDYITPVSTPRSVLNHTGSSTPLTPSARISALNIVGDLLRKVGALESKLASCRSFVKESPRGSKTGSSTSPLNSPSWSELLKIPSFLQTSPKAEENSSV